MIVTSLMKSSLAFLCVLLLLSGCAQYRWFKPGATQSDFNVDSYECQVQAAAVYPTHVVSQQITPTYVNPSTTNCHTTGYVYGRASVHCTTTPGAVVPGVVSTIDVNARNRDQIKKNCMVARGWELREVDDSGAPVNSVSSTRSVGAGMMCQVDSDCTSGKSCRSVRGGGTECR